MMDTPLSPLHCGGVDGFRAAAAVDERSSQAAALQLAVEGSHPSQL